jgi:hypothetical protein
METLIELTEVELEEVAGGVSIGQAEEVVFSSTATGPNARVNETVNISTALPT